MGPSAQQIIDFQNEADLRKRQIAATIHGDEFHAALERPRLDFSEGMEFLMKVRANPDPHHILNLTKSAPHLVTGSIQAPPDREPPLG